jgi:hypothetical protein
VTLAYCYQEGGGLPCRRLLICWEERQPNLRAVLARRLSPEEWLRCFETPPPPKVVTLLECIRKAEGCTEDGAQQGEKDPPGK